MDSLYDAFWQLLRAVRPYLWWLVPAFVWFDFVHRLAVSAQEASRWWKKPYPPGKKFFGWDFWHWMKNVSYFSTRLSAICGAAAFGGGLVMGDIHLWLPVVAYTVILLVLGLTIHPHRLLLHFWRDLDGPDGNGRKQ